MRRGELRLQAVAADEGGVSPTGEDQAIVGPQKELMRHLSQGAEPAHQRMLQGASGSSGLTGSRQMPAQKFARVAVNRQRQSGPAVAPGPNPAQVCRTALVWSCRDRWNGLDAGPHADRALADLPALDLQDTLHRVSVEAQDKVGLPAAGFVDRGLSWHSAGLELHGAEVAEFRIPSAGGCRSARCSRTHQSGLHRRCGSLCLLCVRSSMTRRSSPSRTSPWSLGPVAQPWLDPPAP